MGERQAYCVSGIVLTRGILPHATVMRLVKRTQIPVVLVDDESYAVVSRIRDLTVKMQPGDTETIQLAQRLVEEHVDIDRVLAAAIPSTPGCGRRLASRSRPAKKDTPTSPGNHPTL